MRRLARSLSLGVALLGLGAPVLAGTIDTTALEGAWPKQRVRNYEVWRYMVRWRERASSREGIFAGAEFTAPAVPASVWDVSEDYTDLGRMTPGIESVTVLEQSPTRQVVQTDIKVLWKTLRLTFEIEQDPPRAIRFRLINDAIGEYLGVCRFSPHEQGTAVEMATWLRPAIKIAPGLILLGQRIVMLRGIRQFLKACEEAAALDKAGPAGILPR
ncbi:MAG: SRPBCC family protein [Candidatus Omnitrophica bacterium]|nr:SRPBCC family protein [Candidatus Omnitrophota bacterium]